MSWRGRSRARRSGSRRIGGRPCRPGRGGLRAPPRDAPAVCPHQQWPGPPVGRVNQPPLRLAHTLEPCQTCTRPAGTGSGSSARPAAVRPRWCPAPPTSAISRARRPREPCSCWAGRGRLLCGARPPEEPTRGAPTKGCGCRSWGPRAVTPPWPPRTSRRARGPTRSPWRSTTSTVARHRALGFRRTPAALHGPRLCGGTAAAGQGRRGDLLAADRRRDRRPGPRRAPGIHPGRPYRTPSRAGAGAPPRRPRRGRPRLRHLGRHRPQLGPQAATVPPTAGSRRAISSPSAWAPTYRGYRCEIGRTFVIGTTPADWQIELYDLVFAAQRAGREALAPGAAYREVDRAARQVLDAAGYSDGLPALDRTRGRARNRRGPAVGARGHG